MKFISIVLLCLFCQCCFAQHWQHLGSGLDISATCFFTDTLNDKLYVGGPFTRVDGDTVWGIASWDGNSWDSLGHGINRHPNSFMPDNTWGMAHLGSYLYVGGSFTWTGNAPSPYLSRWDGSNWSGAPGGQPNSVVEDVIVYNNELYICGVFDSIGNVPANGIAKWNGSAWEAIGNNYVFVTHTNGIPSKMAFYHGNLYLAGIFDDPLGNTCRLAKWDGSNWQFFTNELTGGVVSIFDLKVYNNELYISGLFYQSAGNAGNCIVRWNDTTFRDVGGSVGFYSFNSPQVRDMCVNNGKLYCAGDFERIGGITAMGLASWDGTQWCGYNTDFEVNSQDCGTYNLEFYHDTLYMGGGFRQVEGDTMYSIAEWIGGNYVDTCGFISTGINQFENQNSNFSIFPNPANGFVTIHLNNISEKNLQIKIVDVLGQTVIEKKEESISGNFEKQIDVSELTSGIYFVMICTGEKEFSQKILIQH